MNPQPALSDLTKLVLKFRAERDWEQFHTPKELAISLIVEAAELLEIMQWRRDDDLARHLRRRKRAVADELADCLHSILLLASDLSIDLADAFIRKLKKTARRYPACRYRGRPDKAPALSAGGRSPRRLKPATGRA